MNPPDDDRLGQHGRDATTDRTGRPQPGSEPVIAPSAEVLLRHNARLLDPTTAVRLPATMTIRPTVYVGDQLLISGDSTDRTREALARAAAKYDLRVLAEDEDDRALRAPRLARQIGFDSRRHALPIHTRVRLVPRGPGPSSTDAWPVLLEFRSLVERDSEEHAHVALDHLLTATADIGGVPFIGSHSVGGVPFIGSHGVGEASSEYGVAGFGGRQPVEWVGSAPHRRRDDELADRRPVVAVLDTGAGEHPWLPEPIVQRHVEVSGIPIGFQNAATNSEITGTLDDPLEGTLDSDAGHGTFIAGLIRQKCPDADILAIRVMPSDGAVPESELLDALNLLALRQHLAQEAGDAAGLIDVLSLSLGQYHEQPADLRYDHKILAPLRALSRMGVVVVASAGNDSSDQPMFPAAFSPHPGGYLSAFDADCVPLLSVGAINPDRTVALFSNGGDWVACYRPGAAVVRTFPITFNAAAQPSYRLDQSGGQPPRETIDPDDFRGGFGVWSGTSFSAPILAGQLAQSLLDGVGGPLGPCDPAQAVTRAWAAVTTRVGVARP